MAAQVPVALAAARASLVVLPRSATGGRRRGDLAGLVSGAVGLPLVLLALAGGASWGWGSPRTVLLGLGGAAALAVFAVVELAAEEPLVDLDPLRDPTTAIATTLLVVLVACALASACAGRDQSLHRQTEQLWNGVALGARSGRRGCG